MLPPQPDVTTLLRLAGAGDRQACAELFRQVEGELRQRAHAYLRRERPDQGLQTTVLIDDVFLKLVGNPNTSWQDRAQFYRFAARAMRQLLIDHARQRNARDRGGGAGPAPLDQVPEPGAEAACDPLDLLALDEALTKLAAANPDLAEIVELHHFGGWDLKQIAEEILRVSYKRAKTRWQLARAWLRRELQK